MNRTISAIAFALALSDNCIGQTLSEAGGQVKTVYDFIDTAILGHIAYTHSASVDSFTSYYYGYYHNNYFYKRWNFKVDQVTGQRFYETRTIKDDGSTDTDTTPFAISFLTRRSYRCDSSQTNEDGTVNKTVYNALETFTFALHNNVVSESGVWPHKGPFAARVVFGVAPLAEDCVHVASIFPVSDYVLASVPKNGIVSGLTCRLMNRQYTWTPDIQYPDTVTTAQ